ncbi:hypothetical protein [Streptomyces sp. NPDC004134]|uniref:hypothetical protein n=1 Tax=Streptomyces sp. NPDC004134 TaxID=3364691 RepID=UPI003679DB30
MVWQTSMLSLGAGEVKDFWVSWGDTWRGLQYIQAKPFSHGIRLDIIAYGIRNIGVYDFPSEKISYWVTVRNDSDSSCQFVLCGVRLG